MQKEEVNNSEIPPVVEQTVNSAIDMGGKLKVKEITLKERDPSSSTPETVDTQKFKHLIKSLITKNSLVAQRKQLELRK